MVRVKGKSKSENFFQSRNGKSIDLSPRCCTLSHSVSETLERKAKLDPFF